MKGAAAAHVAPAACTFCEVHSMWWVSAPAAAAAAGMLIDPAYYKLVENQGRVCLSAIV